MLVNGAEAARSSAPGSFIELKRTWQSGDTVELQLAMEVAVELAPAAPDIVAFTYGPLVLAGALGREGLAPGSDIVINERKFGEYNDTPFTPPQISGDPEDLAARVTAGPGPLEFMAPAADGSTIRMIPYHRIAHERYATYWPVQPAAQV